MGSIVSDVKTTFLMQHPEQENMLKAFLFGFDVHMPRRKYSIIPRSLPIF